MLLLAALEPNKLRVDPEIWQALVPQENAPMPDAERFRSSAGYMFSPEDGARAVSEIVVGGLLDPRRVERLIAIHTEDPKAFSADQLVDLMVKLTFAPANARDPLAQVVRTEVAERLMVLAADDSATPEAQAVGLQGVLAVQKQLASDDSRLANEIERFLRDPKANTPKLKPSVAPEGPPI